MPQDKIIIPTRMRCIPITAIMAFMKNPLKKPIQKIRSISLKKWSIGLSVVGVVILIGLAAFWYITDYNDIERLNERRFWSAIETALSSKSVVKTTTAGASGKLDTNRQRIFLSGDRLIHVNYTTEVNNPAQSFELNIATEAQQYFDGDNYIRYTAYESTESMSLDEYLGVWALQETAPENLQNYQEQYAGGLVSVIAFADLQPALRAEIMSSLKDVYTVNTQDILTREVDGEEYIQIPVSISLKNYINVLNRVFEVSGYPDLGLDPESAGDGALSATVEIRTRGSIISKVIYGNIEENYSNYGVVVRPGVPEVELSYEELQQAVQDKLSPAAN